MSTDSTEIPPHELTRRLGIISEHVTCWVKYKETNPAENGGWEELEQLLERIHDMDPFIWVTVEEIADILYVKIRRERKEYQGFSGGTRMIWEVRHNSQFLVKVFVENSVLKFRDNVGTRFTPSQIAGELMEMLHKELGLLIPSSASSQPKA
jgi:hypothetical protein